MKIDSVSLFTDASITMYDYFHHGTLLVSSYLSFYHDIHFIVMITITCLHLD